MSSRSSTSTAEGEPLRAPVLEKLLVTPSVERAVCGITKGWRDGIADELRQMLQRGNRRAADPRAEAQVANQISALQARTERQEKVQGQILDKLSTLNRAVTATDKHAKALEERMDRLEKSIEWLYTRNGEFEERICKLRRVC